MLRHRPFAPRASTTDAVQSSASSDPVLEPEQVEHYLGSIEEIQSAVRSGPTHAMTGVKADGTLVGFYVLHPDRRDNSCWWLGWFALDRRYHGRGYGRMAMAKIPTNVRHIVGCHRVRLLVSPANVHAMHLYALAGFHQVDMHTTGELILEVVLSCFAGVEARALWGACGCHPAPMRHRSSASRVDRPACPRRRAPFGGKDPVLAHLPTDDGPVHHSTAPAPPGASTCFDRSPRRSNSAGC